MKLPLVSLVALVANALAVWGCSSDDGDAGGGMGGSGGAKDAAAHDASGQDPHDATPPDGASTDGLSPDVADVADDAAAPGCVQAFGVEQMLANESIGAIWVSRDASHAAALIDFNWFGGYGNLVLINLATLTLEHVALSPPNAARFLGESTIFAYFTFDPSTGWSLNLFDPTTNLNREVASNVVDLQYAKDGNHIAYHTPGGTFLHEVDVDGTTPLGSGADPCYLEDGKADCFPFTFTDAGRLFFVEDVQQGAGRLVGTLASVALSNPNETTVHASGVGEYALFAGGNVLAYTDQWFMGGDGHLRGDLHVRKLNDSFTRTLLTAAAYATPSEHLAVAPDGTTLVFSNPDLNPTTFTLIELPGGNTVWTEGEVPYSYAPTQTRCIPHYLGNDHVIVGKQHWTGSAMDVAYDLVSTKDASNRTRLGEEVRRLGFDLDRPQVALTEHPRSVTKYEGPVTLKTWALVDGTPTAAHALTLPSPPVSIHQRFDGRGDAIALLVDSHGNWRGRLWGGLPWMGEMKEISASADAHTSAWVANGTWLVFLEDAAPAVDGSFHAIRAPFEDALLTMGTSVPQFIDVPGECPHLLYTDCVMPFKEIAACELVSSGLYRVALPSLER